MTQRLQIYDSRERFAVGVADRLLGAAAAVSRVRRHTRPTAAPGRILLLRLERIGDLLMTLPAIADVRASAPDAQIDLVVGGWNRQLAEAIAAVDRVRMLDARWLAREGGGLGLPSLVSAARGWRDEHFDLAINFEPDIRSNIVMAMAGAKWTAGYRSGGGGPLLDLALDYDPGSHTSDNARRLVAAVFGDSWRTDSQHALLKIPEAAQATASARLGTVQRPLVGVHASGGRAVKQWEVDRFAAVARRLIEDRDATVVLTGSAADEAIVGEVKRQLPAGKVIDASGDIDLVALAAVLGRLDLLVTGDTGPMHVAVAMGTPVVAVFGPSDPARYGPRGVHDRVVRVDLPCSPCNRIRLPPARCTGHTPQCLALVSADSVLTAAASVLDARARETSPTGSP